MDYVISRLDVADEKIAKLEKEIEKIKEELW